MRLVQFVVNKIAASLERPAPDGTNAVGEGNVGKQLAVLECV